MLGIIVPGELAVLVYGAGADRMAPDWIPTWALFASATFFAGMAVWVYLSGARSDRKKAEKAALDIKVALRKELREELDARDVQVRNLKDTAAKLVQKPLGDGHTLARLPDGTNIVSMADGSYRLALPVRLSADFEGAVGGSASLKVPPAASDDERPK